MSFPSTLLAMTALITAHTAVMNVPSVDALRILAQLAG
jgi:hypothetical protein